MKVLTRRDVNKRNLWRFILYGWLPIPESIIPPTRNFYLWSKLETIPYDSSKDYSGKFLVELENTIRKSLKGWGNVKRVGVWFSGGVDSSTLLYLTVKILGSEKVRAYTLKFGEKDNLTLASKLVDILDVKHIVKEMEPKDSISLTEEAVLKMRAPIHSTISLYLAKVCRSDGTTKVLSALGLDAITGGYPSHVYAKDRNFSKIEEKLLWREQSYYVWIQLLQSRGYVDIKFPFLDHKLIAYCRGLPRHQKCLGNETKIRLRDELKKFTNIPMEIIEAGRIVGTKRGFTPVLEDWFKHGYEEWCKRNIPPKTTSFIDKIMTLGALRIGRTLEGRLQRKLRIAALNVFYQLLDDGKFTVDEHSDI